MSAQEKFYPRRGSFGQKEPILIARRDRLVTLLDVDQLLDEVIPSVELLVQHKEVIHDAIGRIGNLATEGGVAANIRGQLVEKVWDDLEVPEELEDVVLSEEILKIRGHLMSSRYGFRPFENRPVDAILFAPNLVSSLTYYHLSGLGPRVVVRRRDGSFLDCDRLLTDCIASAITEGQDQRRLSSIVASSSVASCISIEMADKLGLGPMTEESVLHHLAQLPKNGLSGNRLKAGSLRLTH